MRIFTIVILFFLPLIAINAPPAIAGAYVDTSTLTLSRTAIGGGKYRLTLEFQIRRSATDDGMATTRIVNIVILEDDVCGKNVVRDFFATLPIPDPGGLSAVQKFEYEYPCSWGPDIEVSIGNAQGFTGAKKNETLPLGPNDECGPNIRVGTLELTLDILQDEFFTSFFRSENPDAEIPVLRSQDAADGQELLSLITTDLPDPAFLGFETYEVHLLSNGVPIVILPLSTAGSSLDPNTIPDERAPFGDPTDILSARETEHPINSVDEVLVHAVDADGFFQPLPVYQGAIIAPPAELIARRGNVNSGVGVTYEVLQINGERGDQERRIQASVGSPLRIDVLDFPGAQGGPIPYVVYVLRREAGPSDITPHPFSLGNGAFATPIVGGNPIVLLNTLGQQHVLGTPRITGTPPGPGTAFLLPSIPQSVGGSELTLQGIVTDAFAPNGIAAFTNAAVVDVSP